MKPQDERLTPAEFEALCKLLWSSDGAGWQQRACEFLNVSIRSVQYFAAEPPAKCKPVPLAVRDELVAEVRRRAVDPKERAQMVAWIKRHASQLAAMRAALGD